ncbi:hypothetical protein C427_4602 [Paraglaciecola psychrophila 170]|jgi:hypothetical protein|uniref:Uncharacterized protein n=1 Tax=Paraglaciecola psychrophila 170 TaxID=1129794 RepID=K7ATL3_9ALTE|nr:hypothetical protein C427_4602 [Paraglaciecola psychrophila 170]GAC38585.1 hypothetical protein GPSY_2974 [Paraglaciecola psychrophila 170]
MQNFIANDNRSYYYLFTVYLCVNTLDTKHSDEEMQKT